MAIAAPRRTPAWRLPRIAMTRSRWIRGGLLLLSLLTAAASSWAQVTPVGPTATLPLMVTLNYFVTRTRWGKAMRATAQDPEAARMMGVEVDSVVGLSFFIGSALAGASGLIFGLYYNFAKVDMGFAAGLRAFTAAVLGGIGSLPGAVIGGILIGLIETLWSAYFSIDYKDVAAFSVLAITLIFLPQGLFGRPDVEKV